jgi:hypothetical protein
MSRWRAVVLAMIVGAVVLILLSALAFDWGPIWQEWRGPLAVRPIFGGWGPAVTGGGGPLDRLGGELANLVAQFLVGVLILFAAPRHLRRLSLALAGGGARLLRYTVVGLLLAIAIAAVGLLSIFSVHTFPLPFILGAGFFLAALIGVVALTYRLGVGLTVRAGWSDQQPLTSLALGTLIVFALTRVPFLGVVILAAVWLTGAGAAIASRLGSGEPWSLLPLLEEPQS